MKSTVESNFHFSLSSRQPFMATNNAISRCSFVVINMTAFFPSLIIIVEVKLMHRLRQWFFTFFRWRRNTMKIWRKILQIYRLESIYRNAEVIFKNTFFSYVLKFQFFVSRHFGWSSIFCFMIRLVSAIKDGHGQFYDLKMEIVKCRKEFHVRNERLSGINNIRTWWNGSDKRTIVK